MHPTISLDIPAASASAYRLSPRASRTARNRFTNLRKTRSAYSCDSRHRFNFASARAFASARLSRVGLNFCMGKERSLLPGSFKNLSENDATPSCSSRLRGSSPCAPIRNQQSAIRNSPSPRAGKEKFHRVTATSSGYSKPVSHERSCGSGSSTITKRSAVEHSQAAINCPRSLCWNTKP